MANNPKCWWKFLLILAAAVVLIMPNAWAQSKMEIHIKKLRWTVEDAF